jgi:hypothetical protein
MDLRLPSVSPGFSAFLWGFGLGLFIWAFLLAVGVSMWTSLVLGIVSAFLIFFYVRLYGADPLRR